MIAFFSINRFWLWNWVWQQSDPESGNQCLFQITKQRARTLYFLCTVIFQGCGLRSFPIGGILDAPTQFSGSPVSTAFVSNAVFVSKLTRSVALFSTVHALFTKVCVLSLMLSLLANWQGLWLYFLLYKYCYKKKLYS